MKKIRCYVIDDEPDAVALLCNYINETPGLELIGSAENPLESLDFLTGPEAPELTFMDIDMRQLSGLELAGLVNLYTTIVFTTAHPQFALQAFENEAFDYLLKPIDYSRFLKSVQRVKRKWHRLNTCTDAVNTGFFNIKSEIKGRMVKIQFNEVVYIEGAANYIQVYTIAGKHMTYLTLTEIMQRLPKQMFSRVHRSFIVNISYVRIIERNQLRMENGQFLPMGDHYKQEFLDQMDEHLLNPGKAS